MEIGFYTMAATIILMFFREFYIKHPPSWSRIVASQAEGLVQANSRIDKLMDELAVSRDCERRCQSEQAAMLADNRVMHAENKALIMRIEKLESSLAKG